MTQACGAAVTRLTIDIRHLALAAALSLAPENRGAEQADKPEINAGKCSEARKSQPDAAHERRRRLVGLSKHLCGVATDLSLRCIKAYQGASVPGARTQASVGGVCIALCCHHLMTWQDYVGHEFLRELGCGEADFERLRRATSWATGCRACRSPAQAAAPAEGAAGGGGGGGGVLSAGEKEEIGRCCKRLLDVGRLRFVQDQLGLEAELVSYAPRSVTPENALLLAWMPSTRRT